MAKWTINDTTLTGIADAVRAKRGTSSPIQVSSLASEIGLINTGLLRDSLIFPDKYNTGCRGTLTKFDKTKDTSGLTWRDSLSLDFNASKTFQNIVDDQVIVFENYDFTGLGEFYFMNVQSYTTDKSYYKDNLKFVFKNCLFEWIRQDYPFPNGVDISIELYNCTLNRVKIGKAILDRCLIGNVSYYQDLLEGFVPSGDTFNPQGPVNAKNCYIMDVEAKTQTQGGAHIDGFQTIVENGTDMHLYNCRFECFDMPYTSQGEWSYCVYWQITPSDSSMEYCVIHGGGYYGLSMGKGTNQIVRNNLLSGEYHCAENAPESDWTRVCYPYETCYQVSDGIGDYIRTLLVSSVWVEDGKIKVCYSNDMHSVRTMRIVTDDNTTYTVSVPACPIRATAASEGVTEWSDLPLDLVTEISAYNVHSISIYDGNTLVRTFVVDPAGSEGGSANLGTKSIISNGTYNASSDNLDGYSQVTVNVPSSVSGTIPITENGTYDVSQYANANVQVPASLPEFLYLTYVVPEENTNSITVSYDPTKTIQSAYLIDSARSDTTTYTQTSSFYYKYRNGDNAFRAGTVLDYQGGEKGNVTYGSSTVDTENHTITFGTTSGNYLYRANRGYVVLIVYEPSA